MAKKITCAILLLGLVGCGTIETPTMKVHYIGKMKIRHCTSQEECTELETNGFTGWGIFDGLIGLAAGWLALQ